MNKMISLKDYCVGTIERTLSMMRTAKIIDQKGLQKVHKALRDVIKEQEGKK